MDNTELIFPKNEHEVEVALLKKGVVLIYDPINEKLCEKFLGQLLFLESIGSPPVTIRINTTGGSTDSTCTIHDALKLYEGETTGLVIGKAYSGGSMILQACKKRVITKNSTMLIHYGSERFDREELLDINKRKKVLSKLTEMKTVTESFFFNRSKAKQKDLRALLKRDCIISAKEALKYDLVDEII